MRSAATAACPAAVPPQPDPSAAGVGAAALDRAAAGVDVAAGVALRQVVVAAPAFSLA